MLTNFKGFKGFVLSRVSKGLFEHVSSSPHVAGSARCGWEQPVTTLRLATSKRATNRSIKLVVRKQVRVNPSRKDNSLSIHRGCLTRD